jgi:hypothetical protein
MQDAITQRLRFKRILIVVDDVWECEHDIIDKAGFLGDAATGVRSASSWLLTSRQNLCHVAATPMPAEIRLDAKSNQRNMESMLLGYALGVAGIQDASPTVRVRLLFCQDRCPLQTASFFAKPLCLHLCAPSRAACQDAMIGAASRMALSSCTDAGLETRVSLHAGRGSESGGGLRGPASCSAPGRRPGAINRAP